MSRIIYLPEGISVHFGLDPEGEWVTAEEIPDRWAEALAAIEPLKSDIVKDLIKKTMDEVYEWKFEWVWFTGGMWIPMWINQHGDRIQIAWPPKEWGWIVIVNFHDGGLYDSVLDDPDYPWAGMELLHLAEDWCVNSEYMALEMSRRADAHALGDTYPPTEPEARDKWLEERDG